MSPCSYDEVAIDWVREQPRELSLAQQERHRTVIMALAGEHVEGTMYAFSLPTKADKAAGLEWIHEINTTATAC
jgi:hypothetical protein